MLGSWPELTMHLPRRFFSQSPMHFSMRLSMQVAVAMENMRVAMGAENLPQVWEAYGITHRGRAGKSGIKCVVCSGEKLLFRGFTMPSVRVLSGHKLVLWDFFLGGGVIALLLLKVSDKPLLLPARFLFV